MTGSVMINDKVVYIINIEELLSMENENVFQV
jgi:hypothetical protein